MIGFDAGTIWWLNRERRKHESRAEDFERRAARATDPRVAERLRMDARIERNKARRFETGIRF